MNKEVCMYCKQEDITEDMTNHVPDDIESGFKQWIHNSCYEIMKQNAAKVLNSIKNM